MPPKTPSKDGEESVNSTITVLCNILMSATDLKLNTTTMAPILGLKNGKHVSRSLNKRLEPYGFEYKAGKFLVLGQEPGSVGPDAAAADAGEGQADMSAVTESPAPKKGRARKAPAPKKRKMTEADMDSDEGAAVDEHGVKEDLSSASVES